MSTKKIFVIADCHFESKLNISVKKFIKFLSEIDSPNNKLIILGDLFVLWSAFDRINEQKIKNAAKIAVIKAIENFKSEILLIPGNKDLLFSEKTLNQKFKTNEKYFSEVALKGKKINFGGQNSFFIHGDVIDTSDISYLKFYNLINNKFFKLLLKSLPNRFFNYLFYKGGGYYTTKLKQPKKIYLPKNEISSYLKKLEKEKINSVFIGHFHPSSTIKIKLKKISCYILAPWYEKRSYIMLDKNGVNLLNYE